MAGGMHGRGHVWQGPCVAGGHAWQGGMHGRGHTWQGVCMTGGCEWQGVCMAGGMHGRGHAWHTVNEWVVRILLECILV